MGALAGVWGYGSTCCNYYNTNKGIGESTPSLASYLCFLVTSVKYKTAWKMQVR